MAEYDIGDLVRQSVEFKNIAGVATDPTAVTVTVTKPAGTATTYTYGVDAAVVKDSTGNYHIDLTPATGEQGTWVVRWSGTGALVATEEAIFVVRARYGAVATDLLTLDEAKRAVNVSDTSSTIWDAELAHYITAISLRIDELAGPVVKRTITNEVYDGGSATIWPRFTPVASVTSLLEYSYTTLTTLTAETVSTAPSDAYLVVLDGHNTRIVRRSGKSDVVFPAGMSNVLLTYVAGRVNDTASVDRKFKAAAAIMLSNLWRREQNNPGNVTFGDALAIAGRDTKSPTYAVPNAVLELLADELRPPVLA